jgi:hypothetical protein
MIEIHMIILEGKRDKQNYTKPNKLNFLGTTAIEDCILKLTEIYFGSKAKDDVEEIIRIERLDNFKEFGS